MLFPGQADGELAATFKVMADGTETKMVVLPEQPAAL